MRILPHTNVGGGILVWTLKALSNDRIVSGDSSGCLTVWDVDKHVQLQRVLQMGRFTLAKSGEFTPIRGVIDLDQPP